MHSAAVEGTAWTDGKSYSFVQNEELFCDFWNKLFSKSENKPSIRFHLQVVFHIE